MICIFTLDMFCNGYIYLSHLMTKPTKWHMRPAKTQISLGIRPVWSESSLCAQWVAKDPSFLHADSEDSDQTGWMPRLTWVFAGRTCHSVGFIMRRLIWNHLGNSLTNLYESDTRWMWMSYNTLEKAMFCTTFKRIKFVSKNKNAWDINYCA